MTDLGVPGIENAVQIGQGGFGIVYRAHETDLHRDVAVKVLTADLDEQARSRFDRERRAMGTLSGHPNIVTIYRTGFSTLNKPYIVMEFLDGGSMADQLRQQGSIDWQNATSIAIQLCSAIQTAHQEGVLHRDIKPGNVLVSKLQEAKLADFGIARLAGGPETRSANVTASIAHAPPEIIDGHPPTELADIYSLGSTIFELIAGSPAHTRPTDQSMVPVLARIARDPLPPMDHAVLPPALHAILSRAMAKDPQQRPRSAVELGRELAAFQAQHGQPTTPLRVQSLQAPSDATQVVSQAPAPPGSPSGVVPQPPQPLSPGAPTAPPGPPGAAPPPTPTGQPAPPPGFAPQPGSGPPPVYNPATGNVPPPAHQQPTTAAPPGGYQAAAAPPPGASGFAAQTGQVGAPAQKSKKPLVALVVGLLVAAAAIGGFLATRGGDDDDPDENANNTSQPTATTREVEPTPGPFDDEPTPAPTIAPLPTPAPTPAGTDTGAERGATEWFFDPDDPNLNFNYDSYDPVFNDEFRLSSSIPSAWSERTTATVNGIPTIIATPNLALADTYDVPGTSIELIEGVQDQNVILDLLVDPNCDAQQREAYTRNALMPDGLTQTLTGCDGGQTAIFNAVFVSPADDVTVAVVVQALTERDVLAAITIFDSLIATPNLAG